uniref:Putative secreted protein n=1 Tax=Anopheles marajoara TaxID=58244 RepID=A0A2M4CDT1_9DIPT
MCTTLLCFVTVGASLIVSQVARQDTPLSFPRRDRRMRCDERGLFSTLLAHRFRPLSVVVGCFVWVRCALWF